MIMRNTIQKTLVLDVVHSLQNHPTASEVYDNITNTHPTISRATVYRNLNQLAEIGEIQKIEVADGADLFDHRLFKHYHIKCSSCRKIFDVEMEYIQDLDASLKDVNGFSISCHDIMFKGICPECNTSLKA